MAAFPAAADVTSLQSGHWSNPATWEGERVPDELDHVRVSSGHEVVFDPASTLINGMMIEAGALLRFDPLGGDNVLETDANVLVEGELEMRPGAASEQHVLRFVGVDNGAFQGGGDFPCGTDPVASDVGLWVLCDGLLDVAGTAKTGWTDLQDGVLAGETVIVVNDATGWRVGDQVIVAPSEPLSVGSRAWTGFEERTIAAIDGSTVTLDAALSHDHPANAGFQAIYTAEVMNMTRNVRIEGTPSGNSHVLLVPSQAQTISYAEFNHMGVGGRSSGRYGLHFHRAGDGSRGTVVRGTVLTDGDNHAYVPHTSHGITFEDVIAYDFHEEPYWWDQEDLTDDVLFDRAIAAKSLDESDQRYSAFLLGAGHNMTVRNSACVGMVGGIQSGCWLWDADVNNEPNIWDVVDNVAHNNVGSGFFIWQNCPHLDVCAGPHINDGFVAYNNAEAGVNDNGRGINHGAYNNAFQFYNLEMFANEDADIEIHARSRAKDFDEFVNQERTDGYVNAWDTFDVDGIRVVGHASAAKNPTLLIDGSSVNGVILAETYVQDGTECRRGLFDFVRTGLEPEDFSLVPNEVGSGLCPDSVLRVQRVDGTAYQLTDTDEDGALEVKRIEAFYDDHGVSEDTEAPTVPQNLVATAVGTDQIDLSWDASADNIGVAGYRVYRDGAQVAEVTETSYSDTGLAAETTYTYEVSAFDAAGNESARSPAVSATTPANDTDTGDSDDGSTDDGSTDDGSTDDGSTDDGSTDDGSTDDGSTDDGPDGAIAHWRLDEGDGNVAGDSIGSNDGVITGATWVAGHIGSNALLFDGVDDRVELGAFDIPGSALTIAAWINADNLSGDWRIVSKATGSSTQEHWWMVSLREGKLRFRLKIDGRTRTLVGAPGPSAGTWHHVAAVYDGSTMRLYLDAVEIKSRSWPGTPDTDPSVSAWIGGNPDGRYFWPGRIDDVHLYDRALSASEVADLHGGP